MKTSLVTSENVNGRLAVFFSRREVFLRHLFPSLESVISPALQRALIMLLVTGEYLLLALTGKPTHFFYLRLTHKGQIIHWLSNNVMQTKKSERTNKKTPIETFFKHLSDSKTSVFNKYHQTPLQTPSLKSLDLD